MDVKGGQIECAKGRLELTGEGDRARGFLKSMDDLILSIKVNGYVHGLVRG